MISAEGLASVQQLQNGANDQIQSGLKQQAAQQASDLFKAGDIKGALSTLARVDPEHAASMIAQFQQLDPAAQQALHQGQAEGSTQGQYNVMTPAGSNPRQLLDASIAGKLAIEQQKASQPKPTDTVVRNDPNSPTGFSLISKKTGEKVNSSQASLPNQKETQAPQLRPNEDINSDGEKVMLTPEQQKTIKEVRKTFDSETKDIVKGIDAGHQALIMIDKNIPGSEALEKIRVLRSVAQARINTQEFQQYGKDMGLFNTAENQLSKAGGKGMSPQVQQFMKAVAQTAIDTSSKEYDQHLKNAVERNPEVDSLILKKRLVGSGPTVYQAITKKVNGMSPEDQAAFNWAHNNEKDPRAKAILQKLGF